MRTERKIKKICNEIDMPDRDSVYPLGVSAKAPKRGGNGRLALELAASGALLVVMVLAVAIGPGLIRKDYVAPGAKNSLDSIYEITDPEGTDNKQSADDVHLIKDEYWFDYLGLNERALVEEVPRGLMLEYRITADDADSPIWSASDGELIPFVIRRTRYLDSSDYRSALKKIEDKGIEANQETRYRLVAEKTDLTYETVKNLIDNAEYMGSNIDELYDIAGQEYVDLVLSTRPSQEVVDAYNAVIYDERYKTAYLDAIRDPDNLLFYKDDAEKLKNERFEEMKTLVENEGCMIVADLNDEEWANALASLRGYCVAFGTAAQVKSLLNKLDYDTELFYAPKEPFEDDWLFGYVDPDTVNWEAIQDKWPNQLLDEETLYFRQNINSKALYIK